MRGFANIFAGAFETAAKDFDRSVPLFQSMPEPQPSSRHQRLYIQSFYPAEAALNQWFLGYPQRAQERMDTMVTIALKSGSKDARAGAYSAATLLSHCRREAERTRDNAEALRTVANELNDRNRAAIGQFYLGWSLATLTESHPRNRSK